MVSPSKNQSGPIVRVELEGAALIDAYPSCRVIFKDDRWYDYCKALLGHHLVVTRTFTKGFDGEKVKFKMMVLRVTEDTIAKATGLPTDGEKWFKRTVLKPSEFNHLLVSDHRDPYWRKGIPRIWVNQEFWDLIYLIQKYISCEGRFTLVFLYHLWLLAHLVKEDRLSLPFYFLRSLTKMASNFKWSRETADTYLFHQGLIKILIMHELQRLGQSWDHFLYLEGFKASTIEPEPSTMS